VNGPEFRTERVRHGLSLRKVAQGAGNGLSATNLAEWERQVRVLDQTKIVAAERCLKILIERKKRAAMRPPPLKPLPIEEQEQEAAG